MTRKTYNHTAIVFIVFAFFMLLLAALPARTEAADDIRLGGTDISYYNDGKPHSFGGGQYTLSQDRKTLYLNNINITTSAYYGLYATDGELKIILSGNNTIKETGTSWPQALFATGDLEISGSGQLVLEAGDSTVAADNLKVTSGTIIVKASKGDMCVSCTNFHMTGGEISTSSAASGEAEFDEFVVVKDMTMDGGLLETRSLYAGNSGQTTLQRGGEIVADTIWGYNTLSISGGKMTANEKIRYSGGINITGDNMSVSAKKMHTEGSINISNGSNSTIEAESIYAGKNITIVFPLRKPSYCSMESAISNILNSSSFL